MTKGPELKNPTIDHLSPGMMVRAKVRRNKNYGIVIRAVDVVGGRVEIGEYIGGTKERYDWFPVSVVHTAWSVGTPAEAAALLASFNAAFCARVAARG